MKSEIGRTKSVSVSKYELTIRFYIVFFSQFGQKLGLSDIELLEATGNGRLPWRKIVVNLIVKCFKGVNLENENFTTLRSLNKELIDNISG